MSILSKVSRGRLVRPQKIVVYAPESWGKSTLASKLPNPIFLDTEGSTHQMDVNRINARSYSTVCAAIQELIHEEHDYKTLVIDTIDWLERYVSEWIVATANSEKIRGMEDFGYGKGWVKLSEEMSRFLGKLNAVLRKGIHVCLLGHAKVVKFEPPDESQGYDRYELKLSKNVGPMVKEWADCVLFGNYQLNLRENDAGRIKATGGHERLIHTTHTAAWDAKNRYRLPPTISVSEDPDAPLPSELSDVLNGEGNPPAQAVANPQPKPRPSPPAWIANLRAVMAERGVTDEQVNDFLADRGEIPADANWRQVHETYAERIALHPGRFINAVIEHASQTQANHD